MKRIIIIGLIVTTLISCKSLVDDVVPSAMESNYPSVEFSACGQRWNGIGICSIQKGYDLESLDLSMQGYYNGSIKSYTTCVGVAGLTARYVDNSQVPIPLRATAQESCFVGFVNSPELPKEDKSGLVVKSFYGFLYIKVLDQNQPWHGYVSKVPEGINSSESIMIPVQSSIKEARVVFKDTGCGVDYDKTLPVREGIIQVSLRDLSNNLLKSSCIVSGVVFDDQPIRLTWVITRYSKDFAPLPIPTTVLKGKTMRIDADKNVSIISLDGKYGVGNRLKYRPFDMGIDHIFRAFTIHGRLILGEYTPEGGWLWKL